jgi:hypothetical protein
MVAGVYCEFILKDKGNLVRVYSSSSREKGIRSFFGSEKKILIHVKKNTVELLTTLHMKKAI